MTEQIQKPRPLNRTAVRTHALECSLRLRAGKFVRVSEEFLDDVEAEIERLVRNIRGQYPTHMHKPITPDGDPASLVTGELLDRVRSEMDDLVRRIIQNKVQRHPSIGCTLK